MFIALGAAIVVILAVVAIAATRHPKPTTGRLSRQTRARDQAATVGVPAPAPDRPAEPDVVPGTAVARRPATPATHADPTPARVRPTAGELGVTRRQFFNRSIMVGLGLGVGAFGASTIAFLWPPPAAGGFGGKIDVGSTSDAQAAFAKQGPYYNATAKTYMVPYPKEDLAKAKKVSAYTAPIIAGMEAGYVALYQRCVHLGCRVPFCATSQWFECPCHGSKYNRVGEKRGGPAPRGLDRFTFEITGGQIVVDTGNLVLGPPIGTDTTSQSPEGAPCV